MDAFEVKVGETEGISVITVKGYCNAEAGTKLLEVVDTLAAERKINTIIDFAECKVINSPGIASLMDLTLKILDDFKGRLIFTGLDNLKLAVMKMARLVPMVPVANTIPDGLKLLKG